jgi:WD40 repeat protein
MWSEGAATFEPYHLAAAERETFQGLADRAHTLLAAGGGPELAQLGHQLYRALFRLDAADGNDAQEIGRWLDGLRGQNQVESLEFLSDAPGRVPWNVLLDATPQAAVPQESFWGCRYNLAAGRRTNPLRCAAPLVQPTALLATDAALLDQLSAEGRARLESWVGERLIIDEADALASQLRHRAPDVLVLLARVDDGALRIGSQRVTPAQLQKWIGDAREGNPSPVIFLGGVGTAEQLAAWPDWLAAASQTLDALVTNEVPLGPDEAAKTALAFAQRFLESRQPVAAAAAEARRSFGAAGLSVTAFCPPALRTADEGSADPAGDLPRQALPDYPYCPLHPYEPDNRPLFLGREEESLRLAALLDTESTASVILHGGPAVGKTSLVQAGLWPYLEQECVGYRVLCDRSPEEAPLAEDEYPPLSVRASNDLVGQLAEALLAFCSQPLTYTTPVGKVVTVDLPGIVGRHVGVPTSTAIQQPPAPPLPAEQGEAEVDASPPDVDREPDIGARDLWLALREDATRLGRLLDDVTRQLPYELVLTIDQGEELLTLAGLDIERERRQQALNMLVALGASPARCKVLLIVRTEYYGQLARLLPAGGAGARWKEFFLDELSPADMVAAVVGPTSRDEILYSDEVPYNKYQFAYDVGLPEQIVDEVISEAAAQQHGALPLLQVVCAMLYDSRVVAKKQSVLRASDLKEIGGIRGALGRRVGQEINGLPLPRGARNGLRALIARLTTRHADGRITRDLVAARDLKDAWKDRTPIEQAVQVAAEQAGLFSVEQLLVAGQPGLYVSLADDAIAQAGKGWQTGSGAGWTGRSGVVDTLWIMIPLAMLLAALTYFFTQRYYNESLVKQQNDFKEIATKVQEGAFSQGVRANRQPLYSGMLAQAERALANGDALGARQILVSEPLVTTKPKEEPRGFEWHYLWNRVNSERYPLEGHTGTVGGVAVSADGRLAASAAADGSVRLWWLGRGQQAAIANTGKALHAVALSPDGKTVATAGAEKVVHLWDVSGLKDAFATLEQQSGSFKGHDGAVLALAFDKSGTTLASAGADKTVILWDVKSGKARETLKGHAAPVQALAFTADGKTLASGGGEASVILWAADSGKKLHSLASGYASVSALSFAPDGKTLAIGGAERRAGIEVGVVRFWDLKADMQKSTLLAISAQHGRDVLALAYRSDGKAIASAGKDTVIRLWDAQTGAEAGHWAGHLGWVTALAFTADRATLVSGGYDRSVKAWDANPSGGAQVLAGHKGWVHCVAFSLPTKDMHLLASGGDDGVVKLWEAASGAAMGELTGHAGSVTAVAFAYHKPNVLAVGTFGAKGEGEVKLWELNRDDKGRGFKGTELQTLKGHKGGVTCVAFSPRGETLASGSADKTAIVWNLKDGKALRTVTGHQAAIRCLSFAIDGSVLLTGSADKSARICSLKSGQTQRVATHTDSVEAIDFVMLQGETRDLPGIITGGLDHLIRVWTPGDKGNFLPLGTTRAAGQPITCLLRQGNTMITGGWDGTVRLWSLELHADKAGDPAQVDIHQRFSFTGHTAPVRAVAMSRDQAVLASASHDGTVRLWRGEPARAPPGASKEKNAGR